jgi:hypothetical protein
MPRPHGQNVVLGHWGSRPGRFVCRQQPSHMHTSSPSAASKRLAACSEWNGHEQHLLRARNQVIAIQTRARVPRPGCPEFVCQVTHVGGTSSQPCCV